MTQTWRWVVRYRGYYKVSDHGKVKSVDRKITDSKGRVRTYPGSILTPRRNKCQGGYTRLQVSLSKDGVVKTHYVHHLVLEAFVGPRPKGKEARHYPDRDPTNNHLDNLSWCNKKSNQKDRVFHDTHNRGERHPLAKLSDEKVNRLRRMKRSGRFSNVELSRIFKTNPSNVSKIVNLKCRKF